MQKWHEYANYRRSENADGSYTYFITIEGKDIEVSEAVYKAYTAGDRKMRYMELDLKCDRVRQDADGKAVRGENGLPIKLPEREVSLDKLIAEDWDFPSAEPSAEDAVIARFEIEALHRSLDLLDDDERALIDALFFDGLTEQDYAGLIGLTQQGVNKRKQRILEKIKKVLDSGC